MKKARDWTMDELAAACDALNAGMCAGCVAALLTLRGWPRTTRAIQSLRRRHGDKIGFKGTQRRGVARRAA